MSFSVSPILSQYIGKRFLGSFLMVYGGLLTMIFLIDSLDVIRRLSKVGQLTFGTVMHLTALRLPEVGMELTPFAILIAAVFTFWRLTHTSELIVVRATGVSAWQFLFAPILLGLFLAFFKMLVLSPLSAAMLRENESVKARFYSGSNNVVNIGRSGLWLRQELDDKNIVMLHASNIQLPQWILSPVTVFFFDHSNAMTHRIDAKQAALQKGQWLFSNAWVNPIDPSMTETEPTFHKNLKLPTPITSQDITNRFTEPNTIPFWNLPEYAKIMKDTGFESNPLWAQFYKLLAEPIMNSALILIAAALALRSPRVQRNWWLVLSTTAIGFMVFFMGDFLQALGISDRLPLMVASFVPPTICMLGGLTALLYLEDG